MTQGRGELVIYILVIVNCLTIVSLITFLCASVVHLNAMVEQSHNDEVSFINWFKSNVSYDNENR